MSAEGQMQASPPKKHRRNPSHDMRQIPGGLGDAQRPQGGLTQNTGLNLDKASESYRPHQHPLQQPSLVNLAFLVAVPVPGSAPENSTTSARHGHFDTLTTTGICPARRATDPISGGGQCGSRMPLLCVLASSSPIPGKAVDKVQSKNAAPAAADDDDDDGTRSQTSNVSYAMSDRGYEEQVVASDSE